MSFSSVANALMSLLVAGLTIRWLGLDEAGFVLFLQAIVGANKSVFSLGMAGGCLRFVSESHGQGRHDESRRLINTILSFNVISKGLLALGIAAMIPWFIEVSDYQGNRESALIFGQLAMLGMFMTGFTSTCQSGLEAAQQFRFVSLAGTGFRILSNGSKVALLSISPSLITLGAIEVGMALLSVGIFGTKFVRIFRFIPRLQPEWGVFRMVWRFSRWAYLQSLSFTVLGNLDRVIIGAFFSASVLPFYSMAKRGYLIGHEVIAGLASFFFPMLSSAGEAKHEIIERIEPRVRWILTGIGIVFYGGMILVGPTLLNWIVRPDFGTQIAPLIMIFGCVGVISLQTIMPYHVSMATDRPWLTTLCQYCNTGLTFGIMLIFAWQGSLTGVVAAHLCDVFSVVLYYYLVRRENRRPATLAYQIISPIATSLAAWMVIMGVWGLLFLQGATWYYWVIAAMVALPMATLLAVFLERIRGDRYRHLETVRSIQLLAAERFAPLRAVRIPFI